MTEAEDTRRELNRIREGILDGLWSHHEHAAEMLCELCDLFERQIENRSDGWRPPEILSTDGCHIPSPVARLRAIESEARGHFEMFISCKKEPGDGALAEKLRGWIWNCVHQAAHHVTGLAELVDMLAITMPYGAMEGEQLGKIPLSYLGKMAQDSSSGIQRLCRRVVDHPLVVEWAVRPSRGPSSSLAERSLIIEFCLAEYHLIMGSRNKVADEVADF